MQQGFRLSPQQEAIWLSQPAGSPWLAQCAIQIEGSLERDLLRRWASQAVSRHEILRTGFHHLPAMRLPLMVVGPGCEYAWVERDISDQEGRAQNLHVERILRDERMRAFDLEQGPSLHVCLIVLGDCLSILAITLPALCADTASLTNLFWELGEVCRGHQLEDAFQYIDFSEWQHELLQAEDEECRLGRAYWSRKKESPPSLPKLAAALKHAGAREPEPHRVISMIEPDTAERIRRLAQQFDTSPEAVLLANWHVLLARMFGPADSVIDYECNGRKRQLLYRSVGPFTRTVPVASRLEEQQSFGDVIQGWRNEVRAADEWQEYYEGCATQSGFAFEMADWPEQIHSGGLRLSFVQRYVHPGCSKLKLFCANREGNFTAEIEGDPRFYKEHLASLFNTLVRSTVSNPDSPVMRLPMLDSQERRRVLRSGKGPGTAASVDCIHHMFERRVTALQDRTAIMCAGQSLTYGELNQRANQLAHYLIQRGVGPETIIPICLNVCAEFFIALLGVLKAGAAYAPLSPDHPKARLAQQIAQLNAPALITQGNIPGQLPVLPDEMLCIDLLHPAYLGAPRENPKTSVTAENLAYVIHTSGSAGQPKGVAITHGSLVNYTEYLCKKLELGDAPGQEALQFALLSTITADLGNSCIFPSLVSGGCLHALSYDLVTDSSALAAYNAAHHFDIIKIVPSHLSALLAASNGENILPRRWLILGGESLPPKLLNSIEKANRGCRILNHYGPTETTIGSMAVEVEPADLYAEMSSVPIGYPINNTSVYVLDESGEPVPQGLPGELHIAGRGLARCYINQPEQTAAHFIPDPFTDVAGSRMYRTGDLVRRLQDGSIEFLGRTDHQIKIRGFRIEPGEIESVLNRFPGVHAAFAQSCQDAGGQQQLVAYIYPQDRSSVDTAQLREFLADHLPQYMQPAWFVTLRELPLNSNGKLDRSALPLPQPEVNSDQAAAVQLTHIEEILTGMWAELLGVNNIGIHDNFFHHGGHSLSATQMISRVREVFQVELGLRTLFEAPTPAALAAAIDEAGTRQQGTAPEPIRSVPREGELPLSFSQQRIWFFEQLTPGNPSYIILTAARMTGRLDVAALEQSFNRLIRRHESLRTVFLSRGGQPFQHILPAARVRIPVVDLTCMAEGQRESMLRQLAKEETRRPFCLSEAPLFRCALYRMRPDQYVLVLVIHHIICDGWSIGALNREVTEFYNAICECRSPLLPDLAVQYADFSVWQRDRMRGAVLDEQLTYWKRQLGGEIATLRMPTDRPRPRLQTFRGASKFFTLSNGLTQALMAVSRRHTATLFMTLMAAFKALLYRHTGQTDIVVGTGIANRNRKEIEGLIGFFVNTLVLRTDLSGNPTFKNLLGRVREVMLDAYAHQDLPFERLVEELQPRRDPSRNPFFQVLFHFQNFPPLSFQLPGLEVAPIGLELGSVNFDMTLSMSRSGDVLSGTLDYNTDLFEPKTIDLFLKRFEMLLDMVAQDADLRLLDIPLTSEALNTVATEVNATDLGQDVFSFHAG
ncbi:MAG: amino acid adenylation domain-containing protein [Blastocatellia bacterium]